MLGNGVSSLKGIGKKTEELLAKLEIRTVGELLTHFPQRYMEFHPPCPILSCKAGENIAILAKIKKAPTTLSLGSYKVTRTVLSDGHTDLAAVWYNSPFIVHRIESSKQYIFTGRLSQKKTGLLLEHPLIYTQEEYRMKCNTLQPVYSLTAGISNSFLIKQIRTVLNGISELEDYLPQDLLQNFNLSDYDSAMRKLHMPKNAEEAEQARKRMIFDDFFLFLYQIRLMRKENCSIKNGFAIQQKAKILEMFYKHLPYTPTGAQSRVIDEILSDMESAKVMNRLLQGDVGSGKTLVAAAALYMIFSSGFQGVVMVPTEVLAKQHFLSMQKMFDGMDKKPKIDLLTGSMSKKEHLEIYEKAKKHEIDILIGTHTLIQEELEFAKLALVITDEQHRFGVRQRRNLGKKGRNPHILVMSATPIPRTLALILYGDLDISVIDEKPEGRLAIKNAVIREEEREKAYIHIENEIKKGHQAYIICPLVEAGENTDIENVFDYREKLAKTSLKNYNIDIIYGRMSQNEKNRVMEDFIAGRTDVLLSTTVVEVGVDVPNATVMLIENAQQFGLASLHQLRGRVGRGKEQSYCIFVRTTESRNAKKRLDIIGKSNDGFFIAAEDLKLRGPGELFGIAQSGELKFSLADIYDDSEVFKAANKAADAVLHRKIMLTDEERKKFDTKLLQYREHFFDKVNL